MRTILGCAALIAVAACASTPTSPSTSGPALSAPLDPRRAYAVLYAEADAHYATRDWTGAADRYRRAIGLRPDDPQSRVAAYGYVLATRHAHGLGEDDPDPTCAKAPPDQAVTESPVPERAVPILAAYDFYLGIVDEAPQRPLILYNKASLLYDCGHFAEAESPLADITDHAPSSQVAGAAAAILLDCLNQQRKKDEMLERAAAFERAPFASDPALAPVLGAIRDAHLRR